MPEQGQELIQKILESARALPPMPQVIARANRVLSDEKAGFSDIAQVFEADQAMAARVLRLANSAYYGVRVPVNSVQQASALLGFKTLFEMIVVVSSSKMMGKQLSGYGIGAGEAWKHSLFTALAARTITEENYPDLADDAFITGLLHDAGMLILDPYIAKEKKRLEKYLENGKTIEQAETEIFGFNHAQLGSEYLKEWKLSASQAHAIGFHHYPSESEGDILSFILHTADAAANQQEETEKNFAIEEGATPFIGITSEKMEKLRAVTEKEVERLIESMETNPD
ncbi:MAG: HDOD domain-containing protein [Desulfobacteraceae bacterium]|nr:HDOD domain-containing protein [Desulfobacteraceae bacterium]